MLHVVGADVMVVINHIMFQVCLKSRCKKSDQRTPEHQKPDEALPTLRPSQLF